MKNKTYPLLVPLALLLPLAAYLGCATWFGVNAPFWDDYPRLLESVNSMLQRDKTSEQLFFLLIPHPSGHLPAVTRLLLLAQAEYLGGINFHALLVAANAGWAACSLLLVAYLARRQQIPLPVLLPIPLLMAGITHWEAMDFTLTAWQMYWGGCLLVLAAFMLAEMKHGFFAAVSTALALFLSGGTLAVYPLVVVYLSWRRYWKALAAFVLPSLVVLLHYLVWNPPARQIGMDIPSVTDMALGALAFLGNILSNGVYDISPWARLYQAIGLAMVTAALFLARKTPGADALKLFFLYVMLLAGMAAAGRETAVAPRYGMFAIAALASLYGLFITGRQAQGKDSRRPALIASIMALGLSAYSYMQCLPLLQQNQRDRTQALTLYIQTQDPQHLLWWDKQRAARILEDARNLGIYDYRQAVLIPPQPVQ